MDFLLVLVLSCNHDLSCLLNTPSHRNHNIIIIITTTVMMWLLVVAAVVVVMVIVVYLPIQWSLILSNVGIEQGIFSILSFF